MSRKSGWSGPSSLALERLKGGCLFEEKKMVIRRKTTFLKLLPLRSLPDRVIFSRSVLSEFNYFYSPSRLNLYVGYIFRANEAIVWLYIKFIYWFNASTFKKKYREMCIYRNKYSFHLWQKYISIFLFHQACKLVGIFKF